MIVGREPQIEKLLELLESNKSAALVLGESGIGKSTLIEEFYRILLNKYSNKYLVGFYDKSKVSLSASNESHMYPFIRALESLLYNIIQHQSQNNQNIEQYLSGFKNAVVEFIKDSGFDLAIAIIEDTIGKIGLNRTLNVLKEFPRKFSPEKTGQMLADSYVSSHASEAIQSYLKIFEVLANQYKEHHFVLIFDQFESTGKTSIDFLRDFISFMPEKFHIVVSFKEEEMWDDTVDRKLYEYIEMRINELKNVDHRLKVEVLRLPGLSSEAIGEWIKIARGVKLKLPQLQEIKRVSSGFPFLLNQWINDITQSLNPEMINPKIDCEKIIKRKQNLNDDNIKKLNNLTVLREPLPESELASLLEIDVDQLSVLLTRLEEHDIFEGKSELKWFKHELTRSCLERDLGKEIKKESHRRAAEHFSSDYGTSSNLPDFKKDYRITGAAYHFYNAGDDEPSYFWNKLAADLASKKGKLDLAERSYNRAIEEAKKLEQLAVIEDEKLYWIKCKNKCIFDLTRFVLFKWGRYEEALLDLNKLREDPNVLKDKKFLARVYYFLAGIYGRIGKETEKLNFLNMSKSLAIEIIDRKIWDITEPESVQFRLQEEMKHSDVYDDNLAVKYNLGALSDFGDIYREFGNSYYNRGEYDMALAYYSRFDKNEQHEMRAAIVQHQIANILRSIPKYKEVLKMYEKIDSTRHSFGEERALLFHQMANVYYSLREYENALTKYQDSSNITKDEVGYDLIESTTLHQMANVYYSKKEYNDALKLYKDSLSLKLKKPSSDELGMAATLGQIGRVILFTQKDRPLEALPYVYHAFLIFGKYHHKDKELSIADLKMIQDYAQIDEENWELEKESVRDTPVHSLLI